MQFAASRATPVSAPLPAPAADQWIDYGLDMRCCLPELATFFSVQTACTETFVVISTDCQYQ